MLPKLMFLALLLLPSVVCYLWLRRRAAIHGGEVDLGAMPWLICIGLGAVFMFGAITYTVLFDDTPAPYGYFYEPTASEQQRDAAGIARPAGE